MQLILKIIHNFVFPVHLIALIVPEVLLIAPLVTKITLLEMIVHCQIAVVYQGILKFHKTKSVLYVKFSVLLVSLMQPIVKPAMGIVPKIIERLKILALVFRDIFHPIKPNYCVNNALINVFPVIKVQIYVQVVHKVVIEILPHLVVLVKQGMKK